MENQSILARSTLRMRIVHNINHFLLVHSFKGSGRLRKLVVKMLMPKPKGPILISTRYGFDIICMNPVTDKGVEKPLFFNGTYEAGTLNVMKKSLRKGDAFIDVGANIGLMSLFASMVVGNSGAVYSFEPEPETFMILKKNIGINKIGNIHALNIASGDSKSKSFIYTNPYAGRGSASLIRPTNQSNSKEYEIYIETLDDFILKYNVQSVRMLKIDVEGWEIHVLKGAKTLLGSIKAPIICVEYSKLVSAQNKQLSDIYYYSLSINDYKIYRLDLPDHDNLFCFLPLHLKDIPKNIFASAG